MTKGRRRQRIGDDDDFKRVNVSMSKNLVDRIDKYAREKNVSRSLLIGKALAEVLKDKIATERFVESVGPRIERYLSEEDERWIDDKIEQILKNQRNPDLQDIHMTDLVEYIHRIDDWYTYASLHGFIFDSFRKPFPKKVQAKIVRMVDLAFWFSERREDERNWNVWYDKTLEHLKNVILKRRRKWDLSLRARLFYDVFGVRMLLRLDDRPIPHELLDFLVECIGASTEEERSEYNLAHLIVSVAERRRGDAVRLKRRLLDVLESEGTSDDLRQYLLMLLKMDQFKGI